MNIEKADTLAKEIHFPKLFNNKNCQTNGGYKKKIVGLGFFLRFQDFNFENRDFITMVIRCNHGYIPPNLYKIGVEMTNICEWKGT